MIRKETTLIYGHGIKGQGQLWYFEALLARNRLVLMRRPEWFAGAFTIGVIRVKGQSQMSLRIWMFTGVIKMESTDWLTCR